MSGECVAATPAKIDPELGGLTGVDVPGFAPRLFTYVRYNAERSNTGADRYWA